MKLEEGRGKQSIPAIHLQCTLPKQSLQVPCLRFLVVIFICKMSYLFVK